MAQDHRADLLAFLSESAADARQRAVVSGSVQAQALIREAEELEMLIVRLSGQAGESRRALAA